MNQLTLTLLTRKLRGIFGFLPSGFPDEWQLLRPLIVDNDGWFDGVGVERIPIHKSWHYPGLDTVNGEPAAIVWHYTATGPGTAGNMARRRQQPWSEFAAAHRKSYPGEPVPQNSWHFSIEPTGEIVQMASLLRGCWHAESKTSKPIPTLGRPNRKAIGIELVSKDGKAFPESQVIAAARVTAAIVTAYKMPRRFAGITHAELDPSRRGDPGKEWMTKHMDNVLGYAYAT